MNTRSSVRFAALLLSGTVSAATLAQAPAPPAPPEAPPSATTQPAAPIERPVPPSPGGPGARPGMAPHGMYRPPMAMAHRGPQGDMHGGMHSGMHGAMGSGFRIVPPGMWWRDPSVVQRLSLTADQTKKMDGIFQQSRLQLIDLRANIEKQNALLDPMLTANPIEQTRALAQIDKVAQARAELEKADAKMLLGIRAVLTPDQWTKLQNRGDRGGRGMGPGGPQGGAGRDPQGGADRGPQGSGRTPRAGGGPGGPADLTDPKSEL